MRADEGCFRGTIRGTGSRGGTSYFDIEPGSFGGGDLAGLTFFPLQGISSRGYPIQAVTCAADGRTARVFVKRDHRGFEARPAERWEIPVTTGWKKMR